MLRRTTLTRAAVPAAAALAIGLMVPATFAKADVSPAEECIQAGNVWIHVAYDDTVTGACATEFATARDALHSTGLSTDTEFVTTVDGRAASAADQEWWSIYFLTPNEDGTYPAEWSFAQVGAAELELSAGSVLGMQLQPDWDKENVVPTNPVEGVVLGETEPTPTPTPTPTATVTVEPTASPEPTASAEPTKTAKPTRPGMPKTGR